MSFDKPREHGRHLYDAYKSGVNIDQSTTTINIER